MRKEEITQKLERILNDYKAKLKGWQNVKRLTKKDGSDFAVKSKNIDGAKFGQYTHIESELHPYLTITYKDNYTWKQDSLQMYINVRDMEKDDIRRNNTDKIKKDGFHYDVYIYDINECFEAINNYIEFLKEKIKDYETQLKNANKYIEKADKIINEIKELRKEKELMSDISNNGLGFAIIEYIKTMI